MLQLRSSSVKIDTAFILGLFTMFVATSLLLVLIGMKQYRHVTDTMEKNYEDRTITSYLQEKIRQQDTLYGVTVTDLEGQAALTLTTTDDDTSYITYIYFYEGSLRELTVTENSVFSLSSGQKIIEAQDFTVSQPSGNCICATITDSKGIEHTFYYPLNASGRKE